MGQLLFLIRVSRPILWPVLPLVYGLGLNAAGVHLSAVAVVQMLLLTLPMNLIGCGLNDIYDFDSDRQSARRTAVWGVVVDAQIRPLVWRGVWTMVPLVLLGAVVTLNVWNIAAAFGLVAIAWAYSVPPLRLKERPPLDSLANGLGYFLLPFVMGYSLGADPAAMPLRYYLIALCVCGIHALAAAADYEADHAAGHRTFAVAFGPRASAAFALTTFLVALALGDYRGFAVRVFFAIAALAAFAATAVPSNRVISGACVTILISFITAAICHVLGI